MNFKQLVSNMEYECVWEILKRTHNLNNEDYEAFKKGFEELKSLMPKPNETPMTLVVAKIEDCFEPGIFIYDVFGMIAEDENHYSLTMCSWNELVGFGVLQKSIEIYGEAEVVAHILYDITFFAYSAKAVDKKIEQEKEILLERHKEAENGQFVPFEEVMAEFGHSDERTKEEKARVQKERERINLENQKIYQMLGVNKIVHL